MLGINNGEKNSNNRRAIQSSIVPGDARYALDDGADSSTTTLPASHCPLGYDDVRSTCDFELTATPSLLNDPLQPDKFDVIQVQQGNLITATKWIFACVQLTTKVNCHCAFTPPSDDKSLAACPAADLPNGFTPPTPPWDCSDHSGNALLNLAAGALPQINIEFEDNDAPMSTIINLAKSRCRAALTDNQLADCENRCWSEFEGGAWQPLKNLEVACCISTTTSTTTTTTEPAPPAETTTTEELPTETSTTETPTETSTTDAPTETSTTETPTETSTTDAPPSSLPEETSTSEPTTFSTSLDEPEP